MSDFVAVVGAGLVGSGRATVFARGGCDVALYDAAQRALDTMAARVDDHVALGLPAAAAVLPRLRIVASLADAIAGASHAQESVPERSDMKRAVSAELDNVVGPDTLIGSSSSGIPASEFTGQVSCRSRCLVAHPVNPPYRIPVVQLVPTPWTDPATVD